MAGAATKPNRRARSPSVRAPYFTLTVEIHLWENSELCSFCAMDRPRRPGSPLRSFERHLRAQNRSERTIGNHRESARLAQAFLEGCGKRLGRPPRPTWRTPGRHPAPPQRPHGRHPLVPARTPGPRPGTAHWAMSRRSRPPACTGTALRRTLLW